MAKAKGSKGSKGSKTSSVAVTRAIAEIAKDDAAVRNAETFVHPHYSVLLHVAWTDATYLLGSPLLHQWEREKRLYNLITSMQGARFSINGNSEKIVTDSETGFTKHMVSLQFFDLSAKVNPAQFIMRDPFTFLTEFGLDVVSPNSKEILKAVKAEIKKTNAEANEDVDL